jgi:hypothetical protein
MAFTNVNGASSPDAEILREIRERAAQTRSAADVARLDIAGLATWCEDLEKADAAIAESSNQVVGDLRSKDAILEADIGILGTKLDTLFDRARMAGILTDAMNTRLTVVENRPEPKPVPPPPAPRVDLSPYAVKSRVETLAADIHATRAAIEALEMTLDKVSQAYVTRNEAADYRMWLMSWAIVASTIVSLLALWGTR